MGLEVGDAILPSRWLAAAQSWLQAVVQKHAHTCMPWRDGQFAPILAASLRNPAAANAEQASGTTVNLEVEMARRAGEGDARAQSWLMRRVLPGVRRVARTFFGSAAEADDAAQICLMAILKAAGQFRGDASLDTWARRIAVRTTLKYARRERRLRPVAAESSSHQKVVDAGPGPQNTTLVNDLRVYLGGLSEVQREAVLLHHGLGHSLAEIADITGASTNTVKSRLRLAMAALRKRMRQESQLFQIREQRGKGEGRG